MVTRARALRRSPCGNGETLDTKTSRHTWTGGQLVVETLKQLQVDRVHGVPGGQTLAITDAILDEPGIRFVTTRHEGAAAVMADAIGRVTGLPGVCLATTGPGATNLLTGVGGALRDSSPVLVITCNNRSQDLYRDDAQAADHIAIFRPLTKWATLVTEATAIPRALQEAALRATGANPGPVLIDFTRSALESTVEVDDLKPAQPIRVGTQHPQADPDVIARAATILDTAMRPVLWLGNGARISGAGPAALQLAEAFDFPVITTFNSIGTIPTDHPNAFGTVTRMGTSLGHRVLRDADVLLAVGNSLNAVSTGRWSLAMPASIIQIDLSPAHLGRNYPSRTLGVLADARAALHQLQRTLRQPEAKVRETRAARLQELQAAKQQWWARASEVDMTSTPMSPDALIRAVRDNTPDSTILVADAGNPGIWGYLWQVRHPDTFFKPVGFGNMGFAVPAAIAIRTRSHQQPVVALVGDGSLGMTIGELETAVREDAAVCVVVMNDNGYGNIRQEQDHNYGPNRNIGVHFTDIDYAVIAAGFGMPGYRAGSALEVGQAVAKILASNRPGLVDARIDPAVSAWTFPLFSRDSDQGSVVKSPKPRKPARRLIQKKV